MSTTPELLILVADDDVDIREALGDALELEGHKVVLARDGRDALARLHSGTRPCAIVLDWLMPNMGGDEFLAHREASAELRAIPVFVVSATHRPSGDPRIQGYLHKPFQLRELSALLHSVCGSLCTAPECPLRQARMRA
jgi:two-component system chemotaxis response regulator CheY